MSLTKSVAGFKRPLTLSHCLLLCGCVVAAVVTARGLSQPDTPDKKLPFAGPPPPEELQVLAPLIGQWDTKWEVRPSLQDRAGYTATGQMTGQWLHNRHFIRLEGTMAGSKYRGDSTVLYSYDARKKVYRRWLFASNGLAAESEGKWDAGKGTMTWKALNLEANETGTITDVIAKDRVENTALFKRGDGQVLTDITICATRKK